MKIQLSAAEFEEFIEQERVLVMFTADWCRSCKNMLHTLQKYSEEFHIPLKEIDVEKYSAIAVIYYATSLPTTILFAGGKPLKTIFGARSWEFLCGQLKVYLEK